MTKSRRKFSPIPGLETRLSEVDAKIAALDKSNDWLMLNLTCERQLILNGLEREYNKDSGGSL